MAKLAGQFTDALVVIYDGDNNYMTQTTVTGHDRGEMYIEVMEGLENVRPGTHLNLLIIHEKGASEFGGLLKSVRQGVYEIPIYGERRRGVRGASRYKLNTAAIIYEITVNSQTYVLSDPADVIVEDISKTGMRFKSHGLRLIIDAAVHIEFYYHGNRIILNVRVVRECINDDGTYSFGCKLIFKR